MQPPDKTAWDADQQVKDIFTTACSNAAESDGAFADLRRTDGVRAISDNVGLGHARSYWEAYKFIVGGDYATRMKEIVYLDGILGPPERAFFDQWLLSPTVVRYLARAAVLHKLFDLNGKKIIEIGCGWGGLCAVINHLYQPASYKIFDLPEVQSAAGRYLMYLGHNNVKFPTDIDEQQGDIVISDFAFSELGHDGQEKYAARFKDFEFGSLTYPPYLGNRRMLTPSTLIGKLKRWAPAARISWGAEDQTYLELAKQCAHPFIDDVYFWRK